MSFKKFLQPCARLFNYLLFYLVFSSASFFLPFYIDSYWYLIFAIFTPILQAPFQAFCISKWGTSIGGWTFGIRIHKADGSLLTFKEALKWALFLGKQKITIIPMRWKRKILALSLSVLCLGGAFFNESFVSKYSSWKQAENSENWRPFASDGKFKVNFPVDPEHFSKEVDVLEKKLVYHEYKSRLGDDLSYVVSYLEIPRKWTLARSSTLLDGALDVILKQEEGAELVSKDMSRHKKFPAMDFLYKKGDDIVEGKLVLCRNVIFKISLSKPFAKSEELSPQPFFDSLYLSQ